MILKTFHFCICNFCSRNHREVKFMIKTNTDYAICDECVQICVDILNEQKSDNQKEGSNA